MKNKGKWLLRALGLMHFADRLRYQYTKIRQRGTNRQFKRDHPGVVLPPDYLMYEAFRLDYYRYYVNGRKTAEWLVDLVSSWIDPEGKKMLDWGCGPGRIIRHLPEIIPGAAGFHGTDYNEQSIDWCRRFLPGMAFKKNDLLPPLDEEADAFDWIYGISIFTHLSEWAHEAWLKELFRVLKPGGILFLTLHGSAFLPKLDRHEAERFQSGTLVVRGQVKEGHRTFIAFHPPAFVRAWTNGFEILQHIPGKTIQAQAEQDVWIMQKLQENQ